LTVGTTAIIKTTGEEVMILAIEKDEGGVLPGLGDIVTVRRPVMSQDGIKHLTESFGSAELETKEEKLDREIKERNLLRAKFSPSQAIAEPELVTLHN
jgi:hypothetical protein